METPGEPVRCAAGHLSSEADYCSECGAKIGGRAPAGADAPEPVEQAACPDCGTVRGEEQTSFCEICGFDFNPGRPEGLHPETTPAVASPPGTAAEGVLRWGVRVFSSAMADGDDVQPVEEPTREGTVVELGGVMMLIGRDDPERGITPEIALGSDGAVSRRHALLQRGAAGAWLLRDIGSANGTQLNGAALQPMQDYPLKKGDEIELGRGTRLRVEVL